jgi:amidophosphoribosyltransferase
MVHDRSPDPAPAAEALPADVDLESYGEGPREECGVFGIYAPDEDVATLTYFALYALQHRGQESAGIAVSDGRRIVVHKDMGLVNQVFRDTSLAALQGDVAVGHCRYSTTGASSWVNAQPTYHETPTGGGITLGHNGNLVNTAELARELDTTATNDSELMTSLLAREVDVSLEEAIVRSAPRLRGAFSVVVMDEQRIHAFRDPNGFRPLQVGRLTTGGWVVASETAALDIVGAVYVRDVEPGEVVTLDDNGIHSQRFAAAAPSFCLFEWVYLARPDHRQDGGSVLYARRTMGRRLAAEAPADRRCPQLRQKARPGRFSVPQRGHGWRSHQVSPNGLRHPGRVHHGASYSALSARAPGFACHQSPTPVPRVEARYSSRNARLNERVKGVVR